MWWLSCFGAPAYAADFSFHLFGPESGFSDTSGECLVADRTGFLYACSFDGVYAFDGRTFGKIDSQQDYRRRLLASNLVLTASNRLVIQYRNRLSIADQPATLTRPPGSLHFSSFPLSAKSAAYTRNLAQWRDGVATIDGPSIQYIAVPDSGTPTVSSFPLPGVIRRLPPAPFEALYSVGGDLWILRSTGEACLVAPVPRCDGVAEGLPREHWIAMARASDGSLLLRSARLAAVLPRGGRTWSVESLPDQGIAYGNYLGRLKFFGMPDGDTATQADDGLAVYHDGHWRVLTTANGIPKGIISAGLAQAGSLWLQVFGSGMERSSTLGRWESITHADGLSAGNAWETTHMGDGSVWAAVDTGLDRLSTADGHLRVDKALAGAGYALSASNGLLWSSNGEWGGLRVVDPTSLVSRVVPMGSVVALARGAGSTMWVGTAQGLFDCDGTVLARIACRRVTTSFVGDVIADGTGGAYYLGATDLRHRLVTGEDSAIVTHWPNPEFKSTVLTRSGSTFWVGGEEGFYRVELRGGLPPRIEAIPADDLGGNQTVAAVLVDHRGWLWVSTEANLTVFNGRRWISLSTEDGMLSDDLDQRGLREDPDGTIWITSAAGVMHLLSPEAIYASQKLNVSISQASFGDRAVGAMPLPFSRKPLTVELGTPGYTAQKAVTFRYRMSGVDDDWVETSGSTVFYPFVPPGHHVFTVVATDQLKHLVSPPQTLLVAVDYPWWRQWWSESLWVAGVVLLLYGGIRLRVRVERARQAELERRVEEVTAEIRQAQAALAHQATHDQLTGMLNRSAVESRLAGLLTERESGRDIVIGLVDIDHFKAINDGWGHLTGDQVLREMGALGLGMLRADEFAGRYGGEEILLVLRNNDGRAVARLAEFHHRVRSHHFGKAGSPGLLSVTCSVGLAAVFAGDSWESLIDRADRALYHAKRSGRDRIAGLAGSAATLEADSLLERAQRSSDAS